MIPEHIALIIITVANFIGVTVNLIILRERRRQRKVNEKIEDDAVEAIADWRWPPRDGA
jgi:hypothetical protein